MINTTCVMISFFSFRFIQCSVVIFWGRQRRSDIHFNSRLKLFYKATNTQQTPFVLKLLV